MINEILEFNVSELGEDNSKKESLLQEMGVDLIDRIIDIPFKQYKGCYFLYYENELVYVGVTCDIAVRLSQHRLEKKKHWDSVKYIEENDYLESIRIENYFIDTYKPKYNKAGSKLHWAIISYGDKFDETKIPYPKGWLKII